LISLNLSKALLVVAIVTSFKFVDVFLTQFQEFAVSKCQSKPNIPSPSKIGIQMNSETYESIKTISVLSVKTNKYSPIQRIWTPRSGKKVIVAFLPHFGALNAWEYAQRLLHNFPIFELNNVQIVVIGIGTIEGAREFAREIGFPYDKLFVDEEGTLYEKLGFSKGFGDKTPLNPLLKLFPMLAGIGSPGTVQEVLRGYVGDKDAENAWIYSNLRLLPPDASGSEDNQKEGQKPLELASLRLQNTVQILGKWNKLLPPNKHLVTQQGGTVIFDGKNKIYQYKDLEILKYTPINEVLDAIITTE